MTERHEISHSDELPEGWVIRHYHAEDGATIKGPGVAQEIAGDRDDARDLFRAIWNAAVASCHQVRDQVPFKCCGAGDCATFEESCQNPKNYAEDLFAIKRAAIRVLQAEKYYSKASLIGALRELEAVIGADQIPECGHAICKEVKP